MAQQTLPPEIERQLRAFLEAGKTGAFCVDIKAGQVMGAREVVSQSRKRPLDRAHKYALP